MKNMTVKEVTYTTIRKAEQKKRKNNSLFLVQIKYSDDCGYEKLMSSNEIISAINMSDCSEQEFAIYDVSEFGRVKSLKIFGNWHDMNNPTYIKITDENGTIVFDGYGEEH